MHLIHANYIFHSLFFSYSVDGKATTATSTDSPITEAIETTKVTEPTVTEELTEAWQPTDAAHSTDTQPTQSEHSPEVTASTSPSETIESVISDLKRKLSTCEFILLVVD